VLGLREALLLDDLNLLVLHISLWDVLRSRLTAMCIGVVTAVDYHTEALLNLLAAFFQALECSVDNILCQLTPNFVFLQFTLEPLDPAAHTFVFTA